VVTAEVSRVLHEANRLASTGVLASAFQKRQVSPAPGKDGQFTPCRGVKAIAVTEIPVIVLADLTPSPHEIGALVVFTNHQGMVPTRLVGGFPGDEILLAIRARMFTDH